MFLALERSMLLWASRHKSGNISTISPPGDNENYKCISEENTDATKCINPATNGRPNYIEQTNDQRANLECEEDEVEKEEDSSKEKDKEEKARSSPSRVRIRDSL